MKISINVRKSMIFILNIEIIFQTVRITESNSSLNMTSPAKKAMKLAATRDEPMKTSDNGISLQGSLFEKNTKVIVWGQQTKAIQVDILTVVENLAFSLKSYVKFPFHFRVCWILISFVVVYSLRWLRQHTLLQATISRSIILARK